MGNGEETDGALAQTQCLLRTEVSGQISVFVWGCVCMSVCSQGDLIFQTYQTESVSTMCHHMKVHRMSVTSAKIVCVCGRVPRQR